MWRNVKVLFAVSVVSTSIALTVASSPAQERTGSDAGARTVTTQRDNNGFDIGWIGLAGLAGLVGLMPKDRNVRGEQEPRR